MATKVLPGGISRGVREIEKPDNVGITIDFNGRCRLDVLENGDSRGLPISQKVAEVLIALGFSFERVAAPQQEVNNWLLKLALSSLSSLR